MTDNDFAAEYLEANISFLNFALRKLRRLLKRFQDMKADQEFIDIIIDNIKSHEKTKSKMSNCLETLKQKL